MQLRFAVAEPSGHLMLPSTERAAALPTVKSMTPGPATPKLSPIAFTLVALAHLGVLTALVSLRVVPVPSPTAAMIVAVIRPTPQAQRAPDVTLPKPKPATRQERPQPAFEAPVLATESAAPTPVAEVARVTQPVATAPIQAPAQPAQPVQVSQTAPRFDADYLENPAPAYPSLSRRAGEEGKVVLRVFVEPSGLPSRVELRASSGFERLDKSAAIAVGRWKFLPARQGSEAVAAWVLVPIVFSLKA